MIRERTPRELVLLGIENLLMVKWNFPGGFIDPEKGAIRVPTGSA